jgi:hypothetical protein
METFIIAAWQIWKQRNGLIFFFLKHIGELCIIILREKERSKYKTSHTLDHGEGCYAL